MTQDIEQDRKDPVFIFDPQGIADGAYLREYPELDEIPEFQPLTEGELKIVWWYANPTSPLLRERHMVDRMRMAHKRVYPLLSKEEANEFARLYKDGTHPRQLEIQEAIDRMRKVKPAIREDVNRILIGIIRDYKEILEKPLTEFVKGSEGETDFNAYINVRTKIISQLDAIVKKAESGWGTRKVSEKKGLIGEDISETYLKSKT